MHGYAKIIEMLERFLLKDDGFEREKE